MKAKLYRLLILLTVLFFTHHSISPAQANQLQFERISIESGLSQSSVLCIYQDSKGFIWFGTYEGLNRYDGYNFKVFKADPEIPYSLSNNLVESIIEDDQGMMWIGTGDGLNCFDLNMERFYTYQNNPHDPNSLSNNYVRYVYIDRSGSMWVGTHGGGLNLYDRINNKFIRYVHDPDDSKSLSHNNVLSILEDNEGNLWIGTDGGLNLFDREKEEFIPFRHNAADINSISHDGVWRIYEDRTGNLWLGTWGGGLNRFDRKQNRFIRYRYNPGDPYSLSHNVVRSIGEDRNGNLWVGTGGGGLNILTNDGKSGKQDKFIHYQNDPDDQSSLGSNSILSILQDQTGIMWIGTNFSGINKFDPGKGKFAHYRSRSNDVNSLNNNSIYSVFEDSKGIIWIGTNGGGLNRFDRGRNKFTHFVHDPSDPTSLSNNSVRTISESPSGQLWVGTDDGLNRFDAERKRFIRYLPEPDNSRSISYNTIWKVFHSSNEDMWVCTMDGLNRYDAAMDEFNRYLQREDQPGSISGNFVWTINEDISGTIWVGTDNSGLNRFDPDSKKFIHYKYDPKNKQSISGNKILSILVSQNGDLWIGTTNGLNRFNPQTETFERFREKDGLPSNTIQGMLEDDHGNLWISTNNGLSKFNPDSKKFKNYLQSDGLQSNEFGVNACYKLKNGEMIFGGINGFNIFHPDSIKDDIDIPAVAITDFKIFNKPVTVGKSNEKGTILTKSIIHSDSLTLSYKDNVISFEFAALHYASPMENRYAYMMEGFEQDWNYANADRRFVTYTNLPGGIYTFRVKGCNNDGVWNEEGAALVITVTPPFWQTLWFRSFSGLFLFSMVFAGYKKRVRKIKNEKEWLEIQVKERTAEIEKRTAQLRKKTNELKKNSILLEKSHQSLIKAKKGTDNILNNVEEGLFLLKPDFTIEYQYSKALEKILETKELGHKNFYDLLKPRLNQKSRAALKDFLDLMFDKKIDQSNLDDLNPLYQAELKFKAPVRKKYLTFNFGRISDNGTISELIVTVNDVTEQIQLAKKLEESKEQSRRQMEWLTNILHVEPALLQEFIESAESETANIDKIINSDISNESREELINDIYRSVHSMKGNASLLDLSFFAEQAHVFEERLSLVRDNKEIAEDDLDWLHEETDKIRDMIYEVKEILGRIGKFHSQFRPKRSYENETLLRSLRNLVINYSQDLQKKVTMDDSLFDARLIPSRYRLLVKDVLIQLVRNALSHGIETVEKRKEQGKAEVGTITLSTSVTKEEFLFKVRDDGHGIRLNILKKKALESGKLSEEELSSYGKNQMTVLLFKPGISTAEKTGLLAGRGMGMDLVKEKIEKNKGTITVDFCEGSFTEFVIALPLE